MEFNIKTFDEWSEEVNESSKYHFSYNNNRYTIHQAKSNPSKFGIKDKNGEWEVFVRNEVFDPEHHDMEPKKFLDWVQRGIKHFNILGEVTRDEVFNSEWRSLFKYELKHKKPINKRYVILKLQCGRRNAKWNIAQKKEEVEESLTIKTYKNLLEEISNGNTDPRTFETLASLQKEINESDPSLKPPKKWFDRMHRRISKQNKDYDDEAVNATIGNIWYNRIDDKKRKEIRGREGKKYGPANESLSMEELKKKYPEAVITMTPFGDKFPNSFFARVDINTQSGEKEYLGALKGPVNEKDALDFFNNILSKNYDKY